jgi:hypothetical protein
MPIINNRAFVLVAGTLLATSACGGNAAVPTGPAGTNFNSLSSQASPVSASREGSVVPDDSTSILKKLKKDVEIGSTVDKKNGDMGPRAISVVRSTFGLKKGQLLVCNFENSAGVAGKGSTIEVFDPKPHSKPTTFTQNSKLAGCDGDAVTATNKVYGTAYSGAITQYDQTGQLSNTYTSHVEAPFADGDAFCGLPYAPEDVYVSDAKTGAVVKASFVPVSGGVTLTEVMAGFGVNKASGWSALGPSGIQYNNTRIGPLCNDTLYLVDGVDNTVVSISNASNLLVKDEIVAQPGGKKFKCLHPTATCATLVYSGSPLNAPVAAALLPNGNLVVANTNGGNVLVEMTPTGKILATKTLDTSKTAHVFGLIATGTSDNDTVIFYTDTATNTLHELEQ